MRERALDKLDNAMQLFGEDATIEAGSQQSARPPQSHLAFFRRTHFLNRELGKCAPRIEVSGENGK